MAGKFSITDAHDIISKKILINRMSITNLETQFKFSQESAKLQVLTMKITEKKLKIIKELNIILENQLNEFDEKRQEDCLQLYKKINTLDTPTPIHINLCKKLNQYEQEMLTLMPKIQYLEQTIPDEKLITNYNIKIKEEDTTSFNCSTDAMGFGQNLPPDVF
jgi:hypothetical protein